MRKLFLFGLSLAVLSNAGAQAQKFSTARAYFENPREFKMPAQLPNPDFLAPIQSLGSGDDKSVQLTYTALFFTNNSAIFNYLVPNTNPIAYEPKSKVLALLENSRQSQAQTDLSTQFAVRYSTNSGSSWATAAKNYANSDGDYWGHPQIGIANRNGGTGLANVNFLLTGSRWLKSDGYKRSGNALWAVIGGEPVDLQLEGPANNNPSDYMWGSGAVTSFTNTDLNGYIMGGVLSSATGSGLQYGQYGVLTVNSPLESDGDIYSTIPSQWSTSVFRNPNNLESSYNGPMYTDIDAQNNIYACVNNIFADNENVRVIAYSKSEDFGKTWSEFSRMPESLFTEYATSAGGTSAVSISPYQQDAFVVTGVNKFSYFLRLGIFNDQELSALHIVEVQYNEGSWKVVKIADFNDIPSAYYIDSDAIEANGYSALVSDRTVSTLGNEIQVAKTADGNNIILKWVDINPEFGALPISPAQTTRVDDGNGGTTEVTVDSAFTTDVYMSYRPIGSDSWSKALNVSNDKYFDKGTKIPQVVPGLTQIPMVSLRFITDTQWGSTTDFQKLISAAPDQFTNMIANLQHTVAYTRVANIVSVEDETNPTSATNFTLNAPKPSPANGETEITFNAGNGGTVRLAVVNTLGVEVATLFNSAVQQGTYGVTFNTNDVPSGAYYITLTVNGVTQTRPLVVVR